MRAAIIYNFCVCQHSPSTLKENQDTFGKIKPEDECKMNDYRQLRYHKGHEKEFGDIRRGYQMLTWKVKMKTTDFPSHFKFCKLCLIVKVKTLMLYHVTHNLCTGTMPKLLYYI